MMEGSSKHVIVPVFISAGVLALALSLVTIIARSPYTHANLDPAYNASYTRTDLSFVGAPIPLQGDRLAAQPASDQTEHGEQVFVVKMCAGCHGLDGNGGIVGPSVIGSTADNLRAFTQLGPKGMPAYAPDDLTDSDLAAMAAFLAGSGETEGPIPTSTPSEEAVTGPQPTATTAAVQDTATPEPSTAGKEELTGASLYEEDCAVCHGENLEGVKVDQKGKTIEYPGLDWKTLSQIYQADPSRGTVEEQVALAITQGQNEKGEDLGPMMPRWKTLSKAQVDSLIQFFKTPGSAATPVAATETPGAAAATETPAVDVEAGEQLYQSKCSSCHGEDLAGITFDQNGKTIEYPPLLWNDLSKLYQTDPSRGTAEEQVALAITQGQDEEGEALDKMMPRWTKLTKEQVESIIAFLKTIK